MIDTFMWADVRPVTLRAALPARGLPLSTLNGVPGHDLPGVGLVGSRCLSVLAGTVALAGMVAAVSAEDMAAQRTALGGGWRAQSPKQTQGVGTRVPMTARRRGLRPAEEPISTESTPTVNGLDNTTVFDGCPGFQSWSPPV